MKGHVDLAQRLPVLSSLLSTRSEEETLRTIPLTRGKVAIVDDEDFEKVNQFKWHASKTKRGLWYAKRHVLIGDIDTTQSMHRFIMGLEHGDPQQVDHRNRVNTLDNRKENLRIATNAQNSRNQGHRKNNTSSMKGASWHKGKWQAQITVNGKIQHLGLFPTVELAGQAYDAAALKYHGEFAAPNSLPA